MATFLQQVANGISLGAAYAAFALGFTLIFGVNRILNLAHGAVFMWGALGAYYVADLTPNLFVAILAGAVIGGLISVLLDLVAFRPLRNRDAPEFAALISSLGALMVLQNLAQRATEAKYVRFPIDRLPNMAVSVGPIGLSSSQVVMLSTSMIIGLGIVAYLRRTSYGTQIRAVAVDERASKILGISPGAVHFQSFFISGALAGVAGVLVAIAFNNVHFLMGEPYLLNGLAVIILGGMGSVVGALVGGLAFGVIHALTIQYLSSNLSQVMPFLMIVAVLLIRPTGLFGSGATSESRVGRT